MSKLVTTRLPREYPNAVFIAEAAAAAKTPEALQAIKDEEAAGENNAVLASAFITILLGGSTALSMAPVSENVKRVGEKVKTGKGRKY